MDICIRPEAIRFDHPRSSNIMKGRVMESVYLGEVAQHQIAVQLPEGGELMLKASELNPLGAGRMPPRPRQKPKKPKPKPEEVEGGGASEVEPASLESMIDAMIEAVVEVEDDLVEFWVQMEHVIVVRR